MRQQRGVPEALVVHELVGLGGLQLPVEEEHLAEGPRVDEPDLLEVRLARMPIFVLTSFLTLG